MVVSLIENENEIMSSHFCGRNENCMDAKTTTKSKTTGVYFASGFAPSHEDSLYRSRTSIKVLSMNVIAEEDNHLDLEST